MRKDNTPEILNDGNVEKACELNISVLSFKNYPIEVSTYIIICRNYNKNNEWNVFNDIFVSLFKYILISLTF